MTDKSPASRPAPQAQVSEELAVLKIVATRVCNRCEPIIKNAISALAVPARRVDRADIIAAMTNYLRVEQDKNFIERLYIVGKTKAADRILALLSGEREGVR
jgi:hypothetical protein